jgi:hypothetical protein
VIEAPSVAPVIEPTSPLRLSEALRLGSLTTRQGFGTLHGPDPDQFCALGTIMYGLTGDVREIDSVRERTGLDDDACAPCHCIYVLDWRRQPLWYVIEHLNDAHEWTRPQIADWLESEGR